MFSVNLKNEEAFLVEKSSGKILAPERAQDAIDRDDLELWLTAWHEELEGLSMDGEHVTHDHTLSEVKEMGILEPPLPTRMISAATSNEDDFSGQIPRTRIRQAQRQDDMPGVQGDRGSTPRREILRGESVSTHTENNHVACCRKKL